MGQKSTILLTFMLIIKIIRQHSDWKMLCLPAGRKKHKAKDYSVPFFELRTYWTVITAYQPNIKKDNSTSILSAYHHINEYNRNRTKPTELIPM